MNPKRHGKALQLVLSIPLLLAGTGAPAQASDQVTWGSFPRLHDGDTIFVKVEPGVVESDKVEVTLVLAPHLSSLKAVRGLDACGGELAKAEVRDGYKTSSFKVPVAQLACIELVKAKFLGVPTGVYKLTDLRAHAGARVTLTWDKD